MLYLILLCLFVSEIRSDTPDFLKQKTIRIYQFRGRCQEYENQLMYLKDIHISVVDRVYYISFKRVSKVNVTDNMKLYLTLYRCRGRESSDSCEKYQAVNINHLCNILNGQNKPWSPLINSSKPPMGCPIMAGVTVVNNGTFDGGAFVHLPVSGWIWKITAKIFNERTNELLLCVFVEAQIAPI